MESSVPAIELPAELRPGDGRFGSGPTKVPPAALQALAATGASYLGTSHRQEGVRSVIRRIRTGMVELLSAPDGYEVAMGNGGATLFWDAAIFCVIERQSQHLVFGDFSDRFAAAVRRAPHLEEPVVVQAALGTRPEPSPDPGIDTYALTHNETSTGVIAPVVRPAGQGLVIVDGTSAAGAVRFDPSRADAYYFSPQKAFAAEGGLWLALLSPAAVERIERLSASRPVPAMLDLSVALAESRRDQTNNTPALATLFLVAHQVEWLLARGGLEWAATRCERSAATIYEWAERSPFASPFVAEPGDRSPTTAVIDLDADVSADTVTAVLRANGIVDLGGYHKLQRNQLRIGVFPAVEPGDVELLTAAIDYVVERL